MSKTKKIKETKDERTFLERLPSNLPFLPVVRRPDFQLRQVRMTLPTSIPPSIITAVVLVGILFIYIGGSFDLTQDPIAFGSNPDGDVVVISPYSDHQYLVEGMAAGLLMFIGAGGFFLIYYSTQYAYSPRNSTVILVVGVGIVVIAWVAIMFMFNSKRY